MRLALSLCCLTLALILGACQEEKSPSLTGIYQTTFENGLFVPASTPCEAPYKIIDGHCIEPYTATDTLGLFEEPNGDLSFAASLSFSNGHSCTINGTAKKSPDGWAFNGEQAQNGACKFLIKSNGGKITFDVAENADCTYYCGARGTLDGAEFPASSKTNVTLKTKDDLTCVSSPEETCPWDQPQKEPS